MPSDSKAPTARATIAKTARLNRRMRGKPEGRAEEG